MKLTLQLNADALIRAMRIRGHELAREIEPRRAASLRTQPLPAPIVEGQA